MNEVVSMPAFPKKLAPVCLLVVQAQQMALDFPTLYLWFWSKTDTAWGTCFDRTGLQLPTVQQTYFSFVLFVGILFKAHPLAFSFIRFAATTGSSSLMKGNLNEIWGIYSQSLT